jgi:hypothetical protein
VQEKGGFQEDPVTPVVQPHDAVWTVSSLW